MTKRKNPKDLLPTGRPPKYSESAQLDPLIDAYFGDPDCDYTMTGLALALDFAGGRKTLIEYANKPGFSNVKKAKDRVEREYERKLSRNQVAGAIFALKNMDWSDRQDVQVEGALKVEIVNYGKGRPTVSADMSDKSKPK